MKLAALCVLAGGCNYLTSSFVTNDFSGDPFPIDVDTTSGAVIVGLAPAGDRAHTAVLEVMSPVTLIDRGPGIAPSIDYPDLTVLGERGPGGPLDLPRAKFLEPQVLTLHPCKDDTCNVGTPANLRPFDAMLGLDAFASDALRLHLAPAGTGGDQIFILPDVAGTEAQRSFACDAVLPTPFRGGGTMVVGGTELQFTNWRIAIDTCLAPRPDTPGLLQSARGVDVLLVASTSIGSSLLDQSAYARYREVYPAAPALETLPDDTEYLPSGPLTGKLANIPSLALVGNSSSSPRAPCRQVYASHFLAQRDCVLGDDCPCIGSNFCTVPAIVELGSQTTGIDFLIVPDDDNTLQALRTELRPDRPEVDGILGTSAMRAVELDIDYPHDRLLGRCTKPGDCKARPEVDVADHRTQINGCIGTDPGPF